MSFLVYEDKNEITKRLENEHFWSTEMSLALTKMLGHVIKL